MIISLNRLNMHGRHVAITRHDVIIEIGLFDHAIFNADALGQRQSDTVYDATLGLGDYVIRLYRDTTIYCAPHIMELDLAGTAIERDLNHGSHLRAGIVNVGGAKAPTIPLAVPTRHLRGTLHHFVSARRL